MAFRNGQILNKLPTYLTDLSECKLIIAASPSLNLEGVPDYVEWLAEQEADDAIFIDASIDYASYYKGVIKGYQTAEQEMFTEEDMKKAIELTRDLYLEDSLKASMLRIAKLDKIQKQIIELVKSEK